MKLHILAIAMLSALAFPAFGQAVVCESTIDDLVVVDETSNCTAVGVGASANIEGTAVGDGANAANGFAGGVDAFATDGVAIGNRSHVQSGVAIGNDAYSYHGVSMGNYAYAEGSPSYSSIAQSTAIGNNARATIAQGARTGPIVNIDGGPNAAVALGDDSNARGAGNVAVGPSASAQQKTNDPSDPDFNGQVTNATAIGARATTSFSNSVALGADSQTNNNDQVSVGNDTLKRQIVHVAAGVADNDAVIIEQLRDVVGGFGGNANVIGGVFQMPTYTFMSGAVYNNVGSALSDLDGRVYNLENNPTGQGPAGADGASAYQVATNNGFTGTEQEWLASLKGDTGAAGRDGIDGQDAEGGSGTEGPQGPAGERGETGLAGSDGIDGDSAYEVAVSEGFQGNQEEWLESLKGRDGRDGIGGSEVVAGDNIEVTKNEDGSQTVNLADDVKLSDQGSLQVGATTVNATGVTIQGGPSMTQKGIDAGNQRVTSVAPGRIEQGSTDAVNGGQIWELDDRWNDRFERTDKRIDGLGAQMGAMTQMVGAAAAGGGGAIGSVQLNAGIGFSGNQAAIAIGWSSRVSPRVSLSGGISFGTGNKPVAGMGISINMGR